MVTFFFNLNFTTFSMFEIMVLIMNGKFLNTTLAVPRIASRSSALKSNSL